MNQLDQTNTQLITTILTFLTNNLITIVMLIVKHYLLYHLLQKHNCKKSSLIFLSVLTPFSIYEMLHQPSKLVIHSLLLVMFNFYQLNISILPFALLVYIQPSYILTIVPIILNKTCSQIKRYLSYLILSFVFVYFVAICIMKMNLLNYYFQMYNPKFYEPSFNLVWYMFSHLFDQYLNLFTTLFMIFPVLFIYPLYIIFKRVPINTKNIQIVFNFCFIIILYTSFKTSIFDIYLYYLLLIPGYQFYQNVPFSIVFIIGGILFGLVGQAFIQQWQKSFIISISYTFYMLLTSWIFTIVYQVQVFNKLTGRQQKKQVKIIEQIKPQEVSKHLTSN